MKNSHKNNLGYLIWVKIPFEYLLDDDLEHLLLQDLSDETSDYLVGLHKAKQNVIEAIEALKQRGISCIRTGLSWAEWESPQGPAWIEWYIRKFSQHFDVLPNLTFTPPSLGIEESINSPPKNLVAYAEFVYKAILLLGSCFDKVELWNEWDLVTDWNPVLDYDYQSFVVMIAMAAIVARSQGKIVVLGGMSGVNPQTLSRIRDFAEAGLLDYFDVVGIHNLRGTWGDKIPSPPLPEQIQKVEEAIDVKVSNSKVEDLFDQILDYAAHSSNEVQTILENGLAIAVAPRCVFG